MEVTRNFSDNIRPNNIGEDIAINREYHMINSSISAYCEETKEWIFKNLHNRTVIAGSALTAMKLFGLDKEVLKKTPKYDDALGLYYPTDSGADYPTKIVNTDDGSGVATTSDETQRIISGFCVGIGGGGTDISDVFAVPYASWIYPNNLVPFQYKKVNSIDANDLVSETYYKGKRYDSVNGYTAYYFKEFANTPQLKQNYISNMGAYTGAIDPNTVYSEDNVNRIAQSFVELHLKITKEDCRDWFTEHEGLTRARINQLSLVSAWRTPVTVVKNGVQEVYDYMKDIRPFSLLNIPTEILSDPDKSISIIYTLYF